MLQEIAMTDLHAFAVAAAIYGGAFLYGLVMLLLRRPY